MKKLFSIIALVAFIGAFAMPAIAADNVKPVISQVADEKPKKETKDKKEAKKSSDCTATAKKSCGGEKEKACGDKDKK
jgi:Skp family chaperone for outer membrane proteins